MEPRQDKDNGHSDLNVLGEPLVLCGTDPVTGYFRDGACRCDHTDRGLHLVCASLTDEFLQYSKDRGNDLVTPRPEFDFPGLKAGDNWCLCALRWLEAYKVGKAPPVHMASTNAVVLQVIPLEVLQSHAHQ